jgi:hypothetical protein
MIPRKVSCLLHYVCCWSPSEYMTFCSEEYYDISLKNKEWRQLDVPLKADYQFQLLFVILQTNFATVITELLSIHNWLIATSTTIRSKLLTDNSTITCVKYSICQHNQGQNEL